ncbi:amine dehydrogenase large subunit [Paracoccus ravus]|uniref:amine dehydrogenase large subunit n=1 Tax=Paracoccus ravus TaxID=2447760 RepID=UPI00106DF784|nr:amine dehydrogenase large subunit [Paracoccus ravus]
MKLTTALTMTLMALAGTAHAADEIQPETLTIEEKIAPGPNVLVMDFGMVGSSPVYVFGNEDLKLKGNIGTGSFGQMILSKDGKTLYTVSAYLERYVYGPIHAVVHEWDLQTMTAKREFEINDKFAHVESQTGTLTLGDGENFLLVQNATPATSVTVVDLAKGADIAEIPTPGCWTAIPAIEGRRFSTICGDGKFASFTYEADGTFSKPVKSEQIFDADKDPLFANPLRVGGKLVYLSFGGNFHVVDDSGEAAKLENTVSIEGGEWAPSGSEVMTYHAASNTIFVMMHKGPFDGSHKNPAEEIWAVDASTFKVKGRSAANGETGIMVTKGDAPDLYGVTHMGTLVKYAVALGDEVALTKAAEREGAAIFPALMQADY